MTTTATANWIDNKNKVLLTGAGILALGMVTGGYFLGDGLTRARHADRSVTVRGLAERDVTADLATWTISYSQEGPDLAAVKAAMETDTASIRGFFKELGIKDSDLSAGGVNVSSSTSSEGVRTYSISQKMQLRTTDIDKARAAGARQFDLVRRGVALDEGSGPSYIFTKLNDIKPPMVAEATKDARLSAEQFAKDSGTGVGGIKAATQGYFSVEARDGDEGYGASDTPYKKVRVVTTVDFYLS